jgi:hypothetical protein
MMYTFFLMLPGLAALTFFNNDRESFWIIMRFPAEPFRVQQLLPLSMVLSPRVILKLYARGA